MQRLSSYKQGILEKDLNIFRTSSDSVSYQTYFKKVREYYRFYGGGINQWLQEDLKKLAKRGQYPVTVNIVGSLIDSLVGTEIKSRSKWSVGSDYNNQEHNYLAGGLSNILYNIQEATSFNHKYARILKDMAICGIAFPYAYRKNGVYDFNLVHPLAMGPDLNDSSPQLTNMQFIWRKFWLPPEVVKRTWKKATVDLELSDTHSFNESLSPEYMDRQSNSIDFTPQSNRLLVVEVQRKEPKIAYSGFDKNDRYFKTFDYETAEKIAASKNEIKEELCEQVRRSLIMGRDTLLESGPTEPSLPIDEYCSTYTGYNYFPCCWDRDDETGQPRGVVNRVIDIARDLNARLSKSLHLLNSKRFIFYNGGKPFPGKDMENLREELRRDDGIIVSPNENYEFRENVTLGEKHLDWVRQYLELAQITSGITREQQGQQTNATSGRAQDVRVRSGINNNLFAYDILAENKKSVLTFYLHMILSGYDRNILASMSNEKQSEAILLNITHQTEKGEVVLNNIDNFPGYIYLKEGPDYRSSFEESQAKLEAFLQNPNASLYVHSPKLMEQIGFTDGEEISQDLLEAIKLKAMAEQGIVEGGNQQQSMSDPNGNITARQQ